MSREPPVDPNMNYRVSIAPPEQEINSGVEWLRTQIRKIPEGTKGLIIIKYGYPYMSREAMAAIAQSLERFVSDDSTQNPINMFPGMYPLVVPHYIDITTLDINEFLDAKDPGEEGGT